MDILVFGLIVAAFIAGAWAYHHFYAKGAVALAKVEAKVNAAIAPTTPPPAP